MRYDVPMVVLKWILVAAAVYGAVVALLYLAQRSLIYHPDRSRISPAEAGLPEAEELFLHTSDGEKVLAWHVAPKPGKAVIIFFHGNAEIVPWRVARHRQLIADGSGLVALSYRGYSASSGQPSEEGLHRDALAAYDFAAKRYTPARLVLWGHSLGSAVAVRLAAEKPVGRLVLEAPFFSAVSIAAAVYPFVPVRLLMRDQFRSDLRIGQVQAPVLIVHGARDGVIPVTSGQRLYDLIRSPKRFVLLPDGDHNNLDDFDIVGVVRSFLAEAVE
jgi:fermentation-respiration switch protein FrsA (DUF1100 family)